MNKLLFGIFFAISFSCFGAADTTHICVTTLFAPNHEIDSINTNILKHFDINVSHIVLNDNTLKLYGPSNPTNVSSREEKRALIAEHKVIKNDNYSYDEASTGKPILRKVNTGTGRWRFAFDFEFYKKYEERAYNSIFSYCMTRNNNMALCEATTKGLFDAYVSPIANQACVELNH